MRLTIVQYAGDYREVWQRLEQGGDETYYGQRYTVESVAQLGQQLDEVTTICCCNEVVYNERLSNGTRAIGAGFSAQRFHMPTLIRLIQEQRPTHLLLRTPLRPVLRWAIQHRVNTATLLADSFGVHNWRDHLRNYRLAQLLNHPTVRWVGNHGINSCLDLAQIGVRPSKIVPWDVPPVVTPMTHTAKQLEATKAIHHLVYVGSVQTDKGVGEAIAAISHLKARGLNVRLTIAGRGEIQKFQAQVQQLKIADSVEFLGLVPHPHVIRLMREASAVLIPSHLDYPEGFPYTIYEALSVRTPIIASTHPMFEGFLRHRETALIFPAQDAIALSSCITDLLTDPALYHQLSRNSQETWNQIQIPVKWLEFIERWLFESPENQQWFSAYHLTSGQYKNSHLTAVPLAVS